MKKFFAFVAAALVAFSFASCNKGGGKDGNFTIAVGDVEATTANVAVTPSDENVYYYLAVYDNSLFETYTYEDAFAKFKEEMEYYVENNGVTIEDLCEYGYVEKGKVDYNYTGLSPKTEYIVLAAQIDENFNRVGDFSIKTFTTPDIVVSETVALDLTSEYTYYADMQIMQILSKDEAKNLEFGLTYYAEDPTGTFTKDNCYEDGQYYWNYIYNTETEDIVEFVELSVNAVMGGEGIYTFSGYAVAEDGVKYTFANVQATEAAEEEEETAPAAAPKKVKAVKDTKTLQAAKHVAVKSLKK